MIFSDANKFNTKHFVYEFEIEYTEKASFYTRKTLIIIQRNVVSLNWIALCRLQHL